MLKVGIILTKCCNLKCEHCGALSHPQAGETFTKEQLEIVISTIAKYPDSIISFTGGEIFLDRELLFFAIDLVRKYKLKYSLVTNGFWGIDPKTRQDVFDNIYDCSLIAFSTDIFHAQYIPTKSIVELLFHSTNIGLNSKIRYTLIQNELELDVLKQYNLFGTPYEKRVEFFKLMAFGRAKKIANKNIFPIHDDKYPCLATNTLAIKSNGNVYACCGEMTNSELNNPLRMGNIFTENFDDILMNFMKPNIVLRAIKTFGSMRLIQMLDNNSHNNSILSYSPCGCCYLLMKNKELYSRLQSFCISNVEKIKLLEGLYYGDLNESNIF
ncbi:radical SAM protein [Wukongibacter sp. M2B1]|uniref:radical SAM/SPASM domain-containing protein n=1 Tax=Wukongibacter sp. M2B1 TaxID=3088895 RepID=UPI003D79A6E8